MVSSSFHRRVEKPKTGKLYGAGVEQRLHLVKPQHDLDKSAKANSGSLLLPQSWQRHIFYFATNRKKCLALQSSFEEENVQTVFELCQLNSEHIGRATAAPLGACAHRGERAVTT